MTHAKDHHKRLQQARQKRPPQAKQRRLQKEREHLQREQARAQRHLPTLEQALEELGLPDTMVAEVQWTLQAQAKLLGKILGLMFPTFFGCRTTSELTRVRVWDKNLPGTLPGAWPTRKWVTHVQRLGQALLETVWRLGLGLGNGTLVIPVDVTIRRPDPVGPGRPCHDKRTWLQVMVERTWVALPRRRLSRPAPRLVADRWFGDSKWMAPVALQQHGTLLVEGKGRDVFHLPDGRRVTGPALRPWPHWPWRDGLWLPGIRYARVTATSPTDGPVTVVIVAEAGEEHYDLLCQATTLTALRLMQAWKRRRWIEHHCRTLTHLLATDACQVQGEDACDGHLVWRLLAGLVLLYTARIRDKGRVTMEALGFSLKHDWRFLDAERLE